MGKLSRDKGAKYERAIAKRLRPLFGEGVRRGIQTRGGGKERPDIVGLPEWLHIEAHHGDRSPWAKLRQAERDQPDPAVLRAAVVRKNGGEELVAMRWETFVALLLYAMVCKTPRYTIADVQRDREAKRAAEAAE